MTKRDDKSLSEAPEGQEAQVEQDSEGAGLPVAGLDAEGPEDELSETDSVAENDESGYVLGREDDRNEPSQWKSDILCVADPFIGAKVKSFYIRVLSR
jgi:hypothetical protein